MTTRERFNVIVERYVADYGETPSIIYVSQAVYDRYQSELFVPLVRHTLTREMEPGLMYRDSKIMPLASLAEWDYMVPVPHAEVPVGR